MAALALSGMDLLKARAEGEVERALWRRHGLEGSKATRVLFLPPAPGGSLRRQVWNLARRGSGAAAWISSRVQQNPWQPRSRPPLSLAPQKGSVASRPAFVEDDASEWWDKNWEELRGARC